LKALIFCGFFERGWSAAGIRRQKRVEWLPGPCAVNVGSDLIGEVVRLCASRCVHCVAHESRPVFACMEQLNTPTQAFEV
jgi:hypothetical protein